MQTVTVKTFANRPVFDQVMPKTHAHCILSVTTVSRYTKRV